MNEIELGYIREQEENEVREKYLVAMAVAMGGDEEHARYISKKLLSENIKPLIRGIDYKRNPILEQPKEDLALINWIGEQLLQGSDVQKYHKFAVGVRALSLVFEDIDSGYFTNL
jgi:hypothetical protein